MKNKPLPIALYIMVVLTPLIVSAFLRPRSTSDLLLEVSVGIALVAFMILSAQILLAGRFKWIEKPFGLDILIRYHRNVALLVVCIIILHPVLLAAAGNDWGLIYSLAVPWKVWLGRLALITLIFNVGLSYYQGRIGLQYEAWRAIHDIAGPMIIMLAFFHSFFIGDDLQLTPMRWIWIVTLVMVLVLFSYHRFLRPWMRSRHNYSVTEVKEIAPKVWTIKFLPPSKENIPSYLPGQFHFLTFRRREGLPEEEHHWTISSSPTEPYLGSTIKALGDFTATLGETEPGDKVTVDGAYGRFSYLLHPGEKELVFIVGGIGITPVRSMIKHLHDTKSPTPVTLLYANNDEKSISFKDELDQVAQSGVPRLTVVHVLSKPGKDWTGETGFINQARIEKYCGKETGGKGFYLCGPQPLLDSITKILLGLGVAEDHIHKELFSFLG